MPQPVLWPFCETCVCSRLLGRTVKRKLSFRPDRVSVACVRRKPSPKIIRKRDEAPL